MRSSGSQSGKTTTAVSVGARITEIRPDYSLLLSSGKETHSREKRAGTVTHHVNGIKINHFW